MPKKSTGISKTSAARMAAARTAEENAKKVAALENPQAEVEDEADDGEIEPLSDEKWFEQQDDGYGNPAYQSLRAEFKALAEQAQTLQGENTRLALEVQELKGRGNGPATDVTGLVRNFALATDSLRSAAAATHKAERHRGGFGECTEPICRASNVAWSEVGGAEGLQLALSDPSSWWEANGDDISALPTQQELLSEQNKAKAPRAGKIVEDPDLPFLRGRVGRAPVGFDERDPDDPGLPGTKGAQAVSV